MKKAHASGERKLDKLFNPRAIAVIGASDEEGGVGNALMRNLVRNDYQGVIYPVNPNRDSVQSIKSYPNIIDIPDKIDLAIIATPAKTVPGIVEECGQAGVSGIVIISAGFAEIGEDGKQASEEVAEIAKRHDMRIIGPNCLGFIRPGIGLNASFANKMALPGQIGFISQSGALCASILDWSVKNSVGFSHFVSVGEALDISFHDLIDYFGSDPDTSSILIYMESLRDARKFMSAARAISKQKPVAVLKVGRTQEGAQAARSHTGSMTGNDNVYDAAFERAGVIRVDTAVELFHVAKTLDMQKRPQNNRLAVVTNAGGPGVIATDFLIAKDGKLAELSDGSIKKMDKFLPSAWSRSNPVDILGDAGPDKYRKATEVCLADKNVDAVLVILTPQAMTNPEKVAREMTAIANKEGKTLMASWMGGDDVASGRRILEKGNIPIYRSPEDAIRTFMYLDKYTKSVESLEETPATIPHAFKPKTGKNRKILKKVIDEDRMVLTEDEVKDILENYDIPVLKNAIAESGGDAARQAAKLGFPVAMKIISPDIIHKTDVGGVVLNVNSKKEVRDAYRKITKSARRANKKADIRGVFIERMVKKRHELLIGCKKDMTFGPAIVFGMGGVAVEIFKDTKVGLPPLNMSLSLRMIEGTKIYKLLKGYRNIPGVDISAIQFLLYKFAYLISDFPEFQEFDINPFSVDESGGVVLDAKAILDKKFIEAGRKKRYSHLVISPYPKEYMIDFKLNNGKKVKIRPIKPEDEKMEAEMFETFSENTQRHRFFHTIGDITHEMLTRFTQIDYDREIALIAEFEEKKKKKMIGVVRLIADPYNETAEFSIVVGDPWQSQGLGNKFTDYILEIAKERGINKVWAKFLRENEAITNMFKKRGFKIFGRGKTIYAELDIGDQ